MSKAHLWELPPGWEWVLVSDVARVVSGGTPSTKEHSFWHEGDIPWITPNDLSGYREKYIAQGERSITRLGLENSGAVLMPAGTVLFSSRAPIGYVAIARVSVATNQGFKNFVPESGIDSEFLYHYLTTAKPLAEQMASGTTFLELSGKRAAQIPVPLPPHPEQRRIVAELETQLSRLDAAVEALRRAQEKLRQYRDSVLKAACEGKLVPTEAELARREGREYEPASALLQRILAERRRRWEEAEIAKMRAKGKEPTDSKWKAKYKDPAPPKTDGLPELPEGWCWATVEQLAWDAGYGTSAKCAADAPGPIVLRIPNVRQGSLVLNDVKRAGKDAALDPADRVVAGDLLVIRTNGSVDLIGRAALVAEPPTQEMHFASYLIRFRLLGSEHLWEWVERLWASEAFRRLLLGAAATSAGQYNVSLTAMHGMTIPLPPDNEIRRIVASMRERHERVTGTQNANLAGLARIDAMRQSLLRDAFSGKLVPQDPNDEPASVLLARIRAEREARRNEPKSTKKGVRKVKRAEPLQRRPIVEVLAEIGKPVPPEDVLRKAGFDPESIGDIEAFYLELKRGVLDGKVAQDRPAKDRVLLRSIP